MNQRIRSLLQNLGRVPTGWWVVLLTLPALVPLARPGFFESHDGVFHVYRLAALDRAVRAGVLYPRWFPEFAFGYGHPVLNFYGPLSYYWGLPFTLLGADAALATKLVLATGLIASALGMYLFVRLHFDCGPALVAAVVYAYLPYHLIDIYVRGAVAECLAFVWLPLVLWAFHRLIMGAGQRRLMHIVLAALLLAALVVTHSLSALIFAPVLAGYAILLLGQSNHRALGYLALTLILGVALSAFYWLPILIEFQYVGLSQITSQGYRDHLLPLTQAISLSLTYAYALEPGVPLVFPLGLVQVVILVAALALPFLSRHHRAPVLFFLAVALVSAFMLTATSLPVWLGLEKVLALLQYPWRFQILTVLTTAFLASALYAHITANAPRLTYGLLLAAGCWLLAWALWHLPFSPSEPDLSVEGMWQLDRELGQIGATWTGEYLPIWVEESRATISHPLPAPAANGATLPAGQVELTGVGHTRYELRMNTAQGTDLALHQFHYPGWQANWQGGSIASRPKGPLGLATFDLPPVSGVLTVRLGATPGQRWGVLLSLAAALIAGVALVAHYQLAGSRSVLRPLLLAACYLLLAAVLLASLALPNGYVRATGAVNANLEDTAELLAYRTDGAAYHPGDTVGVTLYWRALRHPDQDYKTFVHLTDAALTRQPAQHDGDPGDGFAPTTRWLPGELVPDTHYLALPADLPPGAYRLWAGMYEYEAVRNLSVLSSDVPAADNRVLLGEIEVLGP